MKSYITQLNKAFSEVSEKEVDKAITLLGDALQDDGYIYIIGNGGSASIASHFANDLNKTTGKKFRAICLSDNVPVLTAWANDKGYEYIFSEQLKNFSITTADILIAISSSGNSLNIINALKWAKDDGNLIIAFTGFTGGEAGKLANVNIHVPSDDYGIIEPIHDAITHYITRHFKNLKIQ